jgi:hypothetical protein
MLTHQLSNFLKQALVYNHGFEKSSKSQKTYQREFFAGFFMKIDGFLSL